MDKIVDCIYNKLDPADLSDFSAGLKDGQAGMFLFFSLYSECYRHEGAREKAQEILELCFSGTLTHKPCTLSTGYLGVVWALRYIVRLNLLEKDPFLFETYKNADNACFQYFYSFPFKYNFYEDLFSMGLYFLKAVHQIDTIQFYNHIEQLLKLIENCDALLNKSIEGIYERDDMSFRLFHSLFYFLLETDKMKIYPVKTRQLLHSARRLYPDLKQGDSTDRFVADIGMKNEIIGLPASGSVAGKIDFLSEAGYYSVLYDDPAIFATALHLLEKEDPGILHSLYTEISNGTIDIHKLCTLGLGFIHFNYLHHGTLPS